MDYCDVKSQPIPTTKLEGGEGMDVSQERGADSEITRQQALTRRVEEKYTSRTARLNLVHCTRELRDEASLARG